MPRRHGSITVYDLTTEFVEGTKFPKQTLTEWKKFVYFEQDAYSDTEGLGKQVVEDDRIRVKVRYDRKIRSGQIFKLSNQTGYYKIWRTWIDGRRYIELYGLKFDWGDQDGDD